ncbi:hypothetical protein HHI36_002907, partial [Cryptolaemus montrouzieri]
GASESQKLITDAKTSNIKEATNGRYITLSKKRPDKEHNLEYDRILNLNVQCLTNKIDYLDYILNEEKFKIACLTETWMTKEQLDGLVIPHYDIAIAFARVNHRHGGCLILARENKMQ